MIKSVCVFCGSCKGVNPQYVEMAAKLGSVLGKEGIRVIYGGATVGLMGTVADAALAAGGEVMGVIPEALLAREVAHSGLTELKVVRSMMERKKIMFKQSEAFILLPGGLGSLDEFFEALTALQLGFHQKACAILDIDNYYEKLVVLLDHMVTEQFVKPPHRNMIIYGNDPKTILAELNNFETPKLDSWF